MNDLPLSYNINVDKSKKLFDSAEISMIHKNDEEDVNKKKLEDELFLEPEEKED